MNTKSNLPLQSIREVLAGLLSRAILVLHLCLGTARAWEAEASEPRLGSLGKRLGGAMSPTPGVWRLNCRHPEQDTQLPGKDISRI